MMNRPAVLQLRRPRALRWVLLMPFPRGLPDCLCIGVAWGGHAINVHG